MLVWMINLPGRKRNKWKRITLLLKIIFGKFFEYKAYLGLFPEIYGILELWNDFIIYRNSNYWIKSFSYFSQDKKKPLSLCLTWNKNDIDSQFNIKCPDGNIRSKGPKALLAYKRFRFLKHKSEIREACIFVFYWEVITVNRGLPYFIAALQFFSFTFPLQISLFFIFL